MEFTVHHTCYKDGGRESVLENAPFPSNHNPDENKISFLGPGHYFWDYNFEYAKVWGWMHYSPKFFVIEADIIIEDDDESFLDLAGNRKHLVNFVSILREFDILEKDSTLNMDFYDLIDYLKELGAFPWTVIRALDYHSDEQAGVKVRFNNKKYPDYTLLNPRIVICYADKREIVYKKKPFIRFAT